MLHISLFSGLGGFEVAAQWMGWKNIVSCEINEFANTVREFYWPESYHHKDIHTLSYETIDTELSKRFGTRWRNDDIVLTGGFPCQPFSAAGKRKGTDDSRYLWPEMLRVIREVRPKWIVGENVYGLVNWDGGVVLDKVCSDLEDEGFKVLPVVLPAAGVNAPHRRDRIFFIAHTTDATSRRSGGMRNEIETTGSREGSELLGGGSGISDNAGNIPKHAPQDSISHGRILGEPVQEGAGVREQRDACTRDTERVRGEEMAGVAADTQLPRLQGSGESGEVREEETRLGGEGDQPSVDSSAGDRQWDVSDSSTRNTWQRGDTAQGSGECSSQEREAEGTRAVSGQGVCGDAKREGSFGSGNIQGISNATDAPNPDVDGLQGSVQPGGDGEQGWDRSESPSEERLYPYGTLLERQGWENFPTQSPICSRDDELSSRLHGITFSKWRQESIKGYGNAVVPALVYQLFATIQRMEDDPQLKLF